MPAKLVVEAGKERVLCMRCDRVIGDYPMVDGKLECPICGSTYSVVLVLP